MTKLYFFISYPRKKKENDIDISFIVPENKDQIPECILNDENYENQTYYYKKIFMVDKSAGKGKKGNNYYFEFEIGDDKFIISFDSKGSLFVYDVSLEVGKKIIDIRRKISQNNIEYNEKIDFFEKALLKKGNKDKIDELYKETIDLYSKKKGFSFLIALFLKTYEKKDLCSLLMEKFNEINKNPKDNDKNMDRKSYLKEYKSDFNTIKSKADKLIEDNKYNIIDFYGIILSYLNFYDYDNFNSIINDLNVKNPNDLYEILLIYYAHFKYPVKQNLNFFNKFIKYAIKNKEFAIFENGLNYIKDIETFVNVIENNKEEIFQTYIKSDKSSINEKCIIKVDKNLKFKKLENIVENKTKKIKDNKSEKKEGKKEEKNNIKDETVTLTIQTEGKEKKKKKNNSMQIKKENNTNAKKSVKNIKEENDSKTKNKKENKIIFEVIKNIKSIIEFSKKNKTFLIYFTNNFWRYILNYYNEPIQDNILICYKLREIFIKYHDLVIEIFKDKKKYVIKSDAINYYGRDEFAFLLDQIIRRFINNNNKGLQNIDKLSFITQYNPYYIEPKYCDRVDTEIFDLFDTINIDDDFIEDFRRMKFEIIFKKNIGEYINKIVSKIKDIYNFDKIIKLININNIEDKKIFLDALKKKYDNIIKNEIEFLTDEKLNIAVKVVAKLAIINFIYEIKGKKVDFINKKIKKLDKNIIPLIFIEIMKIYINKDDKKNKQEDEENDSEENQIKTVEKEDENIDFKELKDYIFEEYSNKLDDIKDIDNIINLIDCLEGKSQNGQELKKSDNENIGLENNEKEQEQEKEVIEFLKKLMAKNSFTKDEFFSGNQNLKISLLYKLYEKGKIQKNDEEYYENLESLLDNIKNEIDGEITKKKLDEFLKNKLYIKERLSLLNLIIEGFNPDDKYNELKRKNEDINKDIDKLKDIKDNIIIYYRESKQDIIKKIIDVIKHNQNQKLKDYRGGGKIQDLIKETERYKDTVEKIKKVKNFLLFNVIYDMNSGKDEEKNFDNAFTKLEEIGNLIKTNIDNIESNKNFKEIIDKIKEKLSNNEERANEFIQNLKEYYDINNDKLIEDLTILFKSKKYELDINSIIFFFEYFEKKIKESKETNIFEKDNRNWNNILSEKYLNLSKKEFKEIKMNLNELKKEKIYDFQDIKNYNKLFTCLYNKKEAIDFLFSKAGKNIDDLKDRIQPTDRTINIEDIIDTKECISAIEKMKKCKDNFEILTYIKSMSEKTISQFENYSKIYLSVIELNRKEDTSENVYDQVNIIIHDATFNILQDTEEFLYLDYDENEKKEIYKNITMEELIHLKNKIQLKNENYNNKDNEEDKLKSKCKILLFFKNIVSNLEIINEYMKVLRTKGSSLPIRITIKISRKNNETPSIKYNLSGKEINFEEIRDFLFKAKTKYKSQLDSIYKEKLNLRFLYGKQFRSIMKHLESNYNIDPFLRYILNIVDNNQPINEGYKSIIRNVTSYIEEHELYNRNSLDSISTYITSLFKNNDKTLEDHYDKMRIISETCYKGIYLHACENNSMEEFILNLFWDKIKELPIAQNVLITNKETSSEEIQAFFHRAILCNYNTLFVVEINDSFSNYQQSVMNSYIDNLLSYKNEKYNEETKENVDKKQTQKYLDSYIVFVYDKNNKNIAPFLNEIQKFQEKPNKDNNKDKNNNVNDDEDKIKTFLEKKDKNKGFLSDLNNIMVITSDICGLGKSEKIKKIIKDNNKKYFHFPLGGILNKSIIFDKLEFLLNKIKNENYKDIAIHLDLTESKETSIINEFFFSFLITKFYTNNENIIYIPKDIYIYIEIPNCFENYLSKFNILNIFNKENISFDNMPKFNFTEKIINIFNRMLGIDSNEKIEEFVKKYIGLTKYSYHQINIFVKLFISQYNKFKSKLKFLSGNNDVTEKCIQEFAKCTQYFTNGGFAKLLTGVNSDANEKNDEKTVEKNDKIYNEKKDGEEDYIDKLSDVYDNDLRNMKLVTPLIFIIKEKMKYDKLLIPEKDSKEYQNSKDYLKRLKEILNLPNDVDKSEGDLKSLLSIIEEKNNNYVITNDNFKKMVLLVYRIKANVPVIIMGDTGCGKTALITKLNQILNNGKTTVEIINIHPGITDEKLCKRMKEIDDKAKEQNDKELWVFFDEMNTCLSLSLLTEIFINRTYNGNILSENIRLIGACNPYRKRKGNKEKCGLSMSDDNDNELVYLVQPLPQSLLYYVFSFGSIDDIDEKKYIHSIIEKLFTSDEKHLHEITRDAISKCHIYLRKTFDPSVVSLREIARFSKCIEFFKNYFTIKNKYENRPNNENNNKIRSIICSIYLCYYIRLIDDAKRTNFESELRPILLQLVNKDQTLEEKGGNLMDLIKNKDLKDEISTRPEEIINNFSDFLKIEQEYLLNQIELDKGIGKNTLLKENVFLLFLSVNSNIPLIIIGKPGTGKSLSAQLISKSMKGKYSKNKFFQLFPEIIQTYFQGSESTQPEDVENLFDKGEKKLLFFKKNIKNEVLPISLVLFDELGLAERSESNPLKVLHSKLEYGGKEEGVSFVGISNYALDAAKINRALVLSVPDLDNRLDDLIETSRNIVESISEKLKKNIIFEILSKTYFNYKNQLQIIKELVVYKQFVLSKNIRIQGNLVSNKTNISGESQESQSRRNSIYTQTNNEDKINIVESDKNKKIEKRQFEFIKELKEFKDLLKKENKIRKDFHGNRDFYNLIRGIAIELGRLGDSNDNDKVSIITKYIERNFGGIDYEIDMDLNLILDDIRERIKLIKSILEDYESYNENKKLKLSSVFLFKQLYNLECDNNNPNSGLKIDKLKINEYNLNKCINDNIRDTNSRYLLLEIKPSLTTLIYQNIILQNPLTDIILYDGSPFVDDNNKEYRFKIINQIQDDAKYEKLIIIENLNQIHPFLFDLYNMNYIIKDEKKFARICLENFNTQLTLVNDNFRIIILVDKKFINKCDLAFLNRLEKTILSFDKLVDNQLKLIAKNLIDEIKLINAVDKYKINYSLKDLLINCRNEEIQGLIYYYSKESKKNEDDEINNEESKKENIDENLLKEKVINKIYKILPQDIICILQDKNIIREKYCELKNIYNFRDYIAEEDNKKYKISIIYTYTSIANIVEGLNNDMSFMISEIKSEDGLKNRIEEIKIKNENKQINKEYNICIHFEKSNSEKIKFVSNFILKYFKKDHYTYIIIIHINRNFNFAKNEIIYSLPDINPDINQIFIDNLNGNPNMKLNELLTKDIKEILEEKKDEMKLDDEFNKTLKKFLINEFDNTSLDENTINNYINEIQDYMNEEDSVKEKIIETTYKLIEINKEEESNCKDIIDNIYKNNYISIYTLDIVSCLIDYIKENIFTKYLKKVFQILEDNNILTTLLEIKKKNYKFIKKNQVEDIIKNYLDEIIKEKNVKFQTKFLFNYNVPGFYNFFIKISNYINANIISNYFNNEKKLRKLLKEDIDKIRDFHDIEESLLNNVYNEIANKHKFIFETINKISNDLIFKDYVTYYLQKYRNSYDIYNKDDTYHKLIELLLKLRFNEENRIIKGNDEINILLIKIIYIESNVNYILNIFKIYENSIIIYLNNNKKENILYKKIDELIFTKKNINYITDEKRNPEHTKEVNECYYILLASICYCITSDEIQLVELINNKNDDEIQIEINHYYSILKEINKILQYLSDDLFIYLKEMYIIDELIKIIELFKKNRNIEKINEIKNQMRENAFIIQKYSNNKNDSFKLSEELISNFDGMYNLIIKDEVIDKNDKIYYEKLRYIFFKEIKKISDINYRYKILQKLIESNEMIKKSNDIFQILLKNYIKKDKFEDNRNNILNGDDDIIKLLDKKINNNFVLAETLLYFFEKNSLIYLQYILNNKDKIIYVEDEPLKILKDCIELLNFYVYKPDKLGSKLKEIAKIFCIGYIKAYCNTFIKIINDDKSKFKDPENIQNIIDAINGNDSISKMIRLYIYKILYNNYTIDVFINKESIDKYKLNKYKNFIKDIQNEELINIYKIDDKIKTLKYDNYDSSKKAIEKYKKLEFKEKIKTKDFNLGDFGIDNFYVVTYNLILSHLQMENLVSNQEKYSQDFYNNICVPLFKPGEKLLFKAIQLFYDPEKYNDIKNSFKINRNNIKALLFGYRFCLNEILSKNTKGIYYPLYDIANLNYLKEKYYPGNDTKLNKVYYNIIKHFKTKPDEGCYVCLCKYWYYHCVPSGFPGAEQLNKKCLRCKQPMGTYEEGGYLSKAIKIVKRDNYFRIFKDKKEIEKIKEDKDKRSKLKEINYMTLEEFKEKYIYKIYKSEKGVYIYSDKNSFKSDEKVIRNLSQISYRLLNYILYIHLFFARLITNKKDFDLYLPKGMSWVDTLYECWNILKKELLKEDIDIEKFMNYIFIEIFPILNKEKYINSYDDLIKFENKLELLIQKMINKFKEETEKNDLIAKKNDEDKNSFISLLKEKYTSDYYREEEFPFYEYLYYTDYLNEKNISESLKLMDESKYPVLKKYLENKNNNKHEKNEYSLDNLNLYNNVLNLISEKYFNNISREYAKKNKIKEQQIYIDNKKLIEDFIKFYNSLNIKDNNGKIIELKNDNYLSDFFLDDTNIIGSTYNNIYKIFIKEQNEKVEYLLDMKIEKGIFDDNCKNKINIQEINENEIFNLKLPEKVSFIDILFNSSYRKILDNDTRNYETYKEYEINYEFIEECMTDLLLKNKKLLNDKITEFIYNNEVFSNQLSDFMTLFKKRYNCKNLNIHDKVDLYKFYETSKNSLNLCKNMIDDFITLIKFLNNQRKEGNTKQNNITEESKIYELIDKIKDNVSDNFIKIFENNDSFTIDKTTEIFDFYLKLIYEDVKKELENYQVELSNNSKDLLNKYYQKEQTKQLISKKDFAYAIRLFITLILFPEEDKDNKIKSNSNNILNYLKSSDLWKIEIYNDADFSKNISELKLINAQINQIISLYEVLGKDIENNFCDDVREQIDKEKKKIEQEEKEEDNEKEGSKHDNFSNKNDGQENEDEDDDPFGKKDDGSDDDSDRD